MTLIKTKEAFNFYQNFILNHTIEKGRIYKQYGFTLQGSVGSKDWEVFAAILFNDRAKPGDGADLVHHEVKSAITKSSFEYQYHKNHGEDKLLEDMQIDHIFIARSQDYKDIEVWLVQQSAIKPVFEGWVPELKQNYLSNLRQRFRRSVTYKFVTENGRKVMEIANGQLLQ